jgi:hypothetical protein
MDATERQAWLHHCGTLVSGTDESVCPGCRSDVRPSSVEARYILVPVERDDEIRKLIADALRDLAPGHPAVRIWGRMAGATPEQAQEGNAWAADPEDIADLVVRTMKQGPDLH